LETAREGGEGREGEREGKEVGRQRGKEEKGGEKKICLGKLTTCMNVRMT
jgi:hypothetical protein